MDLFKMASQIAGNMSTDDKDAIEHMDIEKMISHVTKNMFKMLNNNEPNNLLQLNDSEDNETNQNNEISKTKNLEFDLDVTLEELFLGKKKKIYVKRKKYINGEITTEKKKLAVHILPGMVDGQIIKFNEEADELPGSVPGDVIIKLVELKHPLFERNQNDLVLNKNINVWDVYSGVFEFKHLDDRHIRFNINTYLNTDEVVIYDEGMPIYKTKDRGDLIIKFKINIPKLITESEVESLKEIIGVSPEKLILDDYTEYLLDEII